MEASFITAKNAFSLLLRNVEDEIVKREMCKIMCCLQFAYFIDLNIVWSYKPAVTNQITQQPSRDRNYLAY
jgi:hypothetical protein